MEEKNTLYFKGEESIIKVQFPDFLMKELGELQKEMGTNDILETLVVSTRKYKKIRENL